jgi:hypothetical protein
VVEDFEGDDEATPASVIVPVASSGLPHEMISMQRFDKFETPL